jgi:hypothetical protein
MASYGGRGLAVTPTHSKVASVARWLSSYFQGTHTGNGRRPHHAQAQYLDCWQAFMQMNVRASEQFTIRERSRVWLYEQFCSLFNRANFSNSLGEDVTDAQFNKPRAFCEGVRVTLHSTACPEPAPFPRCMGKWVDQFLIVAAGGTHVFFPPTSE